MVNMAGQIRRVKNFARENPITARFALDGLLTGSALSLASSNHNLFMKRLGADDYQLSLVLFLPQMFNLLVLIPGGLLTDSLRNRRRMVTVTLVVSAFGYLLGSLSPFTAAYSIPFFLGSISLASGATALYNIAWQSSFPGLVDTDSRNRVLTWRTHAYVFISMVMPLLAGAVLACIRTVNGKIIGHQGFFLCTTLLFLLNAYNFHRFQTVPAAGAQADGPKHISLSELTKAGKSLLRNRPFLLFAGAALFFHMTWHVDWTLYFIGQVSYLHMNEFLLGLAVVGSSVAQLLTLKLWSRMNERFGVVLPFTIGILGLSLCPLYVIAAVSMPHGIGPYFFLVFHTAVHASAGIITLNLFQCLLKTTDETYRGFSMSVFACLICLSNAVMPVLGVALYHTLGGNLTGFRFTYGIVFVLRIAAAGLWLLHWREQSH